ncbi:Thiamin diphosphate-binding protein [Punctularia strigosozonata HHB-11173 SS5]|uniref:thiamine diphosphate-binding protein n=1 Tax=Punctularia strigosozonata (strain HHB-11173) TaxID=741275 RepID=UPI000441725D|nr:thiamine diphosphate-binding protein [Punctularia strigosozonata HHB-11173 SS5]EIN12197.1 Thiamin diphosphate-binding protein [Punctularia strigosozonata HHB-11173 SS5]
MYTTTSVFLATLTRAGVTHAFVNWGSDHPAMLEELARQRRESTDGRTIPTIITCPNEMVALSAAQGYAQITGNPAAVIVHVDVGTQSLGGAVHNVDKGRIPVIIFAGASAHSSDGELKGSRNEWIMWLQDIPDQSAIVRQYMRWTYEIHSGRNVAQAVMRGLQIATSEPRGPIYLWARREAMEEEVNEQVMNAQLSRKAWPSVSPAGLSPEDAKTIASALIQAKTPLIITSRMRSKSASFAHLTALVDILAIPICVSCPSTVCFPFSHPCYQGTFFGILSVEMQETIASADTILILDCDVPWIQSRGTKPRSNARVFLLDSGDPLKLGMGFAHVDAEIICSADAETAVGQILTFVNDQKTTSGDVSEIVAQRFDCLRARHDEWVANIDTLETTLPEDGSFTVPNLLHVLRHAVREHTPSEGQRIIILNEAISNYAFVWTHMRPERAGEIISSGGSSLGWALGAAVGANMGGQVAGKEFDLIVAIVGDGSYLFGAPSSAYWMARKYNTPFLTIVLNNGGWKSPKLSMLGVYPHGLGSKLAGDNLTVGFGPEAPDYAEIAAAAGGAWGRRVGRFEELQETFAEAIAAVVVEKRCAVVDCVLESI